LIPSGKVVQINVSPGGLPKRSVGWGTVTPLGIEGDRHDHPRIHGGPDKALLLIAKEVVDSLRERGFPVEPGSLGENLTTEGLDVRTLRSGQRYRIGDDLIIELTTVRGPCRALRGYGASLPGEVYDRQVRDGDSLSPKWGMSGFYASVLHGGTVRPGAPIFFLDQSV
jgi:MOSC domain-containing protein YiiM